MTEGQYPPNQPPGQYPPNQPPGQYPPNQPPGQYPPPQPMAPNSSKATTSLVLGICSLVLCGFFLGIPAMIIGRQAKREIEGSQGQLGGEGLATAGFITGLIGTIWSALAAILLVVLLRRRGERSAARETLGQALDLAHHCGGLAIAERARQELHIAGARPRRDALRGRDALTPSELRVARMAADGMTNRSIAQALVGLIHGLGCQAVAEGVETKGQADMLRVIGCDAMQGYGIAAPMDEAAFLLWAKRSAKRRTG